jgi:halimadienyl-diphosphate synthase
MTNDVQQLIRQVGPGTMSNVAYDTAWIARLGEIDWRLSSQAIGWLSENQLPDGSWGAERPLYYHDRVISTLAAMIALTYRGRRAHDRTQIERGLTALERITSDVTRRLESDSNGPTVGFEMIAPTLVEEAESLGLIRRQGEKILGRLGEQRRTKLNLLKGKMVDRHITAAFSAEMAGKDNQHMLDIENLQECNGSVGHSPSATAFFAMYVKPGDEGALRYLRAIVDRGGGAPNLMPFDVFEASWVLWNFSLVEDWDEQTLTLFRPVLDFLKQSWKSERGVGLSTGYSVPDGDDTAFVYEVLSRFGEPPDIETVLTFEEKENFRTYHLEANSSSSVNIHALGALRQAGFDRSAPSVQKILEYLAKRRIRGAYWYDKWNLSPYYTTAHAIIACAGFADQVAQPAVQWMLETQNSTGSWGFQFPNAEETAYCIQALSVWRRYGGDVPPSAIKRAAAWLRLNSAPPHRPLWIGKGLYTPELVVRSTILSALLIAEKG